MEEFKPVYLIYDMTYMHVIEITETVPTITDTSYNYAVSTTELFRVGDEFSHTITLSTIDENQNVTGYSAIRNNPQAARLLAENEALKQENTLLKSSMLEMTTYAASQDERIVRQEQSILELTTLIAGGNA